MAALGRAMLLPNLTRRRLLGPLSLFERFLINLSTSLLDVIILYWSPDDIGRMRGTNTSLKTLLDDYAERHWNVDEMFGTWFSDPLYFRALLAYTGAIVSGSQALQFMGREYYSQSDMDIFCKHDTQLFIGRFLNEMGYRYKPRPLKERVSRNHRDVPPRSFDSTVLMRAAERRKGHKGIPSDGSCISAVYDFCRFDGSADGVVYVRKVQLIVLHVDPVAHVTHFHSSEILTPFVPPVTDAQLQRLS